MFKSLLFTVSLIATFCTSAAAQERQWSLDLGAEDAYLTFGVPESDDIGASFWCTMKTGVVKLLVTETDATLKPGKIIRFTLSAGEMTARFKGKVTPNEEAGTTSLEAEIPADHEIFGPLQKADRFKVNAGNEEEIFPLIDADMAGLLAVCKKP